MIAAYINAFQRCYPHHHVQVKPVNKKINGQPKLLFRVIVNNDPGGRLFEGRELVDATKLFNRGRVQ